MWDPRAEEAPDPKIKTGVGNPLSPYASDKLSVEDEKRLDDRGLKVTEGLLWSEAHTGYYLWVSVWHGQELTQLVPGGRGQTDMHMEWLPGDWRLSLGVSMGKPRFNRATVGACIEVPADLGDDSIKAQYMGEWLSETVVEAMSNRGLKGPEGDALENWKVAVAIAASRAIGAVL